MRDPVGCVIPLEKATRPGALTMLRRGQADTPGILDCFSHVAKLARRSVTRCAAPLFGVAAFLGACGGKVVVDGVSGGGAHGAGGSGVACSDAGAQDIPAAERHCATDAECMIEVIVDCCTIFPVGVASSQLGAYDAYQNACNHAPNPPCECPVNVAMTVTEDGKSTPGNVADQAQVACQNGQCSTFMP